MPIAINGSGSITGLSVGGLPDGSVQLADLATTGTASSSTFLRGDGAFAEAGGGKVLQMVTSSNDNNITTSGGAISDLTNVSITPASASNKILLMGTCGLFTTSSSNAYAGVYIYRGTSSGTLLYEVYSGYNSTTNIYFPYAITYVDSPNTTSAQTYTFSFSRQSINTSSVSTSSLNYSLTALEIAA